MDAILQKTPEVYTDAPSTTADTALVEGNYRSAIAEYTALLRTCKGKHAALVHRNRSAAFASMSYSLRMRPASHSEDNALFGQDPTQVRSDALAAAIRATGTHAWLDASDDRSASNARKPRPRR